MDEKETREKLIDKQLKDVGWDDKYIKIEVNSVKSDFKNKNYILHEGKFEKGVDRFIDYVLLAEDYSPLAVVEAKKYSVDPEKGRVQARTYAKDIEEQTKTKVPIFLTNGRKWKFIDHRGRERKASGPFSQSDLKRRNELFKNEQNPCTIKINPKIVDRPKSILIVKQLAEHFSHGHRTALVTMATGTGKTRVSMALIDLLINANLVRNVLFVADRITLANQASSDGFKQFFTEPVLELHEKGFDAHSRLYASTIQTLMGGNKQKTFEKFSPGFFDLIIFDEAHRSIYDKNNLVMQYFDAIKIGLTATPREHESRNTYEMFGCDDKTPTVEYSFDEAVRDSILVNYKAEIIETKVLSLGIEGSKLTPELKDQLRRQEVDPDSAEFAGGQFDKVFMDDKTNELIVQEFMARCYKSDEGLPCKTIVFCASQRHAKRMKKTFEKLFPNLGKDVQVITSDFYRAQDEVRRFKLDSEPRIALSVGMLDTGVDIPEVCNLVFVKPVFSHVRFWQMVGRGTRNERSCKHKEWLPDREKKDFLIMDFTVGEHSNVLYHEFEETKDRVPSRDILTKIFMNRVNLLTKDLDEEQKKIISEKILANIGELNEESFIVREKAKAMKDIKDHPFELDDYIEQLKDEISPLIILNRGGSPNVTSFILKTEQLFGIILDGRKEDVGEIRAYVTERLKNILRKDNLSEIKANKDKIVKVIQEDFWDDLTFENVEFIIKELAPLLKYYEPDPKKIVQIDDKDLVIRRASYVKEIKEDEKLKEFVQSNAIVQKIKSGEGITPVELVELEKQLNNLKPEITIKNIQKFHKKDFLEFLHEIIGLTYEYNPKERIEEEFDKFIIESSHYNSKQIDFLQLLKKVFSDRKYIELKDFANPPLSDANPLDIFQFSELEAIVAKCNNIKLK